MSKSTPDRHLKVFLLYRRCFLSSVAGWASTSRPAARTSRPCQRPGGIPRARSRPGTWTSAASTAASKRTCAPASAPKQAPLPPRTHLRTAATHRCHLAGRSVTHRWSHLSHSACVPFLCGRLSSALSRRTGQLLSKVHVQANNTCLYYWCMVLEKCPAHAPEPYFGYSWQKFSAGWAAQELRAKLILNAICRLSSRDSPIVH